MRDFLHSKRIRKNVKKIGACMRLSRNSLQLIPDKAIANFRCMQIQLYSEVDNYERGSKAYRFSNNGYVKKDIA